MKNQLSAEMVGLHGTNFAFGNVSSPRSTLYASHLSQMLVIEGANEKIIQTGAERDLGQYTFSIKMPEDGIIIKIIDRYPRLHNSLIEEENPETLVIYEAVNRREYGCFVLTKYCSYHQYLGFPYVFTENVGRIVPGNYIEKNVVFADSPSKSANGGYCFGRELNTIYMSHPAVSDDGILISRDVLKHFRFNIYEKRDIHFGKTCFPLNLYGSTDRYQPFPKIGEVIGPHGLLMALRDYDTGIMPVQESIHDVMEPNVLFDKGIYVRGPGGRVIDIKVYHDDSDNQECPLEMMQNVDYYAKGLRTYYREIIDLEKKLRNESRNKYGIDSLNLSPELHRLIVEALAVLSEDVGNSRQRLNKVYRNEPLDEYRIEFVIQYTLEPTEGYKVTDSHGSKGVICQVEEPENMPVDEAGNRADIIIDAGSVNHRTNIGRAYEQYIGASARDLSNEIRQKLNITKISYDEAISHVTFFQETNPNLVDQIFNRLLRFFSIVSPRQELFTRKLGINDRIELLATIVSDIIYIFFPIDNEPEMEDIVLQLEKEFQSTYGPVTYIGGSGQRVTTKMPLRIGPVYTLLLEKIADDGSCIAHGKLQSMGILSTLTRMEKNAKPWRDSAVKVFGETELRICAGYAGKEAAAEIIDRNNCPVVNAVIVREILKADKPTAIDCAVDRSIVQIGNSKVIQLVNHIATCTGWQAVYEPEED